MAYPLPSRLYRALIRVDTGIDAKIVADGGLRLLLYDCVLVAQKYTSKSYREQDKTSFCFKLLHDKFVPSLLHNFSDIFEVISL